MPALNFKTEWADAVELGARCANGIPATATAGIAKRTTIRKPGRAQPGETLHLFTGQRTKQCRKLGTTLCLAVTPIWFSKDYRMIVLGGVILKPEQAERLARVDTAELWGYDQFAQFFRDTYPGVQAFELISW